MITRQSTARTIIVGPILDADGVAKTDEVVDSIKITKNGTVGSADGSATLTHDHAGKYRLALTANDTDTVGVLEISLNSGTNDMPVKAINVVETAVWDALFADGATGMLPANVVQISGDTTAADNLEAALDGTGGVTLSVVLGTDAITAASLADSAGAELAALVETYIVNEGDATAVMQAIADKIAADWVAGDASPLAIVAAIKADATIATMISRVDATVSSRSSHSAADVLTALGTGTWATAIPWNAAWDAEVQSEVQDAIEVNHLDHLLAQTYDPASKPGAADALLNELIGNDAGVSQFTANALELAPSGGGGGGGTDWTADERTAIKAILGIPSSGTTPADPTTGILDTIRDQVVANGTALAGSPISANSRVASGGTITAYIGDDFKVRSDTELSLSVSDVGGALYTKWNAIGEANLYFGASREGADVGAITGTVAAITSVGSGASQTCKLTVEITNCGSGLKPGTYDYQIEQRQTQGSDVDSFIEVAGSLILKRNSVA